MSVTTLSPEISTRTNSRARLCSLHFGGAPTMLAPPVEPPHSVPALVCFSICDITCYHAAPALDFTCYHRLKIPKTFPIVALPALHSRRFLAARQVQLWRPYIRPIPKSSIGVSIADHSS